MRKIIPALLLLATISSGAVAQNIINDDDQINPPVQVAMNNENPAGSFGNNLPVQQQTNTGEFPQTQQIQTNINYNQQVQQQTGNRGNYNPSSQAHVGQSIHVSSGGGGYSGSAGKTAKVTHKSSIGFKIKKILSGKDSYHPTMHYGHKNRVRKCHRF